MTCLGHDQITNTWTEGVDSRDGSIHNLDWNFVPLEVVKLVL